MNIKTYLERNAITVKELREALEDFDDDTRVMFSYHYGDRPNTLVAEGAENVEEMHVRWSDYHNQPRVAEDDEVDAGGVECVVVIGASS